MGIEPKTNKRVAKISEGGPSGKTRRTEEAVEGLF
jgi:hypothetical protein